MVNELTLADGYRVRFPLFVVVDGAAFRSAGLRAPVGRTEDPVLGAYVPVYTDQAACEADIRESDLPGKRAVPLGSLGDLWTVLARLYGEGVPWVEFDPHEDAARSYLLRDVLALSRSPLEH